MFKKLQGCQNILVQIVVNALRDLLDATDNKQQVELL